MSKDLETIVMVNGPLLSRVKRAKGYPTLSETKERRLLITPESDDHVAVAEHVARPMYEHDSFDLTELYREAGGQGREVHLVSEPKIPQFHERELYLHHKNLDEILRCAKDVLDICTDYERAKETIRRLEPDIILVHPHLAGPIHDRVRKKIESDSCYEESFEVEYPSSGRITYANPFTNFGTDRYEEQIPDRREVGLAGIGLAEQLQREGLDWSFWTNFHRHHRKEKQYAHALGLLDREDIETLVSGNFGSESVDRSASGNYVSSRYSLGKILGVSDQGRLEMSVDGREKLDTVIDIAGSYQESEEYDRIS